MKEKQSNESCSPEEWACIKIDLLQLKNAVESMQKNIQILQNSSPLLNEKSSKQQTVENVPCMKIIRYHLPINMFVESIEKTKFKVNSTLTFLANIKEEILNLVWQR